MADPEKKKQQQKKQAIQRKRYLKRKRHKSFYPDFPRPEIIQQAIENPTPETLKPSVVQAIQRVHGNQFVQRLIDESVRPVRDLQKKPDDDLKLKKLRALENKPIAQNSLIRRDGPKRTVAYLFSLAVEGFRNRVFLDEGNSDSGLVHILERHEGDFARSGMADGRGDVIELLRSALEDANIVNQDGNAYDFDIGRGGRRPLGIRIVIVPTGRIITAYPRRLPRR